MLPRLQAPGVLGEATAVQQRPPAATRRAAHNSWVPRHDQTKAQESKLSPPLRLQEDAMTRKGGWRPILNCTPQLLLLAWEIRVLILSLEVPSNTQPQAEGTPQVFLRGVILLSQY